MQLNYIPYTRKTHALHLAQKQFRVFAIEALGTRPIVAFSTQSTTDETRINKIWRLPDTNKNIGVHTGDGLMVLDVDRAPGGYDSLGVLIAKHGELPATYSVVTPSGGVHYYFHTNKNIRNSAGKLGAGLDIRGHNGFVVAAGSVRESTEKKQGGVYHAFNDVPVAPAPVWLEDLCQSSVNVSSVSASSISTDEPLLDIPDGMRNDRIFREGCGLRANGWGDEAISTALNSRNLSLTRPLGARELSVIVAQVLKYPPGDPGCDTQTVFQNAVTTTGDDNRELKPFTVIKSDDLYEMQFTPLKFCVEPLLAEGVYLLNGRPKGGKSWLAMEIASAVATGEPLWDEFKTNACNVLYLALEDGERRLKDRLSHFNNPGNIHFVLRDVETLDTGLITQLDWWVAANPNNGLVIIDIFQQIRGANASGENAYAFDYRSMKPLQEWANTVRISVLIVHHTRKVKTDLNMDSTNGSQGIAGAVDALMFLNTPNNGKTAVLSIESRDTDNGDYDLIRAEKPSGRWEFGGEHNDDAGKITTDVKIIAHLQADGPQTVVQLSESLASARSHVQTVLTRMVTEKRLKREKISGAFLYKTIEQ